MLRGIGLGAAGERIERTRAHKGAHDHEHRRDGPRRRIGQRTHRRLVRKQVQGQQNPDTAQRDHLGRIAFAQKQTEQAQHHSQAEPGRLDVSEGKLEHALGSRDGG